MTIHSRLFLFSFQLLYFSTFWSSQGPIELCGICSIGSWHTLIGRIWIFVTEVIVMGNKSVYKTYFVFIAVICACGHAIKEGNFQKLIWQENQPREHGTDCKKGFNILGSFLTHYFESANLELLVNCIWKSIVSKIFRNEGFLQRNYREIVSGRREAELF